MWFVKVKEFLGQSAFEEQASEYEVWASVLLVFPTFFPNQYISNGKLDLTKSKYFKKNIMYEKLKEEGLRNYRFIFEKNSKKDIDQFLNDGLIRKMWPLIMTRLTKGHIFGRIRLRSQLQKLDICETYNKITQLFMDEYNLPLPQWWYEEFPPFEISLREKRMMAKIRKQDQI